MAKNNNEEEWDPSKPLDDEEEEATVSKTARARARLDYLKEQEMGKIKKAKDGKKKGFLDI